jgi:cell division septum initiation protein DivIVA
VPEDEANDGHSGLSGETGEVEVLLDELVAVVEKAKSMPLSSSAIIARDEVLQLLDAARAALPSELQRARRVLQDRDEVRQRAEREASELIDEARAQAAHMVQRTEVVRQARHLAERLVEDAEAEGRKIRHEADDYVDRKLAAFEIVLDKTMRTVQIGRDRLTAAPDEPDDERAARVGDDSLRPEEGFFDQDGS